ncbi:HNH endonuclease family protein [Kitasatospora sp. NPDC054795]
MISLRWRHIATFLAALALVFLPAAAPAYAHSPVPASAAAGAAHRTLPEPPPLDVVRAELNELAVQAPHSMAGYSRAEFPHWKIKYGTCDTREVVLARDGQDVVQDDQCRAVSGTWESPYDHKVFTDARQLDVDHVVPLANAWRSGADTWTRATREQFANDTQRSQLVAVSAASNRAKADKGPEAWRPPAHDFWCTYSRAWTSVKHAYDLNVTESEKAALVEMLDTCA